MESFITAIGQIVTGAVTWIGSYMTVITGNPILLFFVALSVVGLGVGLIRRLMRL